MLGTLGTIGLTNLFGSNGFNSTAQWGLRPGDNVGGNFGHSLNLWTGATDSANLQYKHNLALQHDAQNFAKWQMQNAHQTEVQDLQNAGLNPILSANGGASAGVSANSTGAGAGGLDPIGMIGQIIGMINSTKTTKALIDKTEAETKNIDADTGVKEQTIEWTPQLNASLIRLQTATSSKDSAEAEKAIAQTLAQQFINKMLDMDVKKRTGEFEKELEIYKQEVKAILRDANVNNSWIGSIINNMGHTVHQLSPFSNFIPHGGNSYNYSPVSVNY